MEDGLGIALQWARLHCWQRVFEHKNAVKHASLGLGRMNEVVRPLAKETMTSATYNRLRIEIIHADLVPGSKINISSVCGRLGVSLSAAREALNRLAAEGFVTQVDQRGFSVAPLDAEDLQELTLARCWLNELGLRNSMQKGDQRWEEDVVLCQHRLSRIPRVQGASARSPEYTVAHRAFHQALIAANGSKSLTTFCEILFDRAERYRHLARVAGRFRAKIFDEHKEIAEAAIARDADLAVRLLNEHFLRTQEFGLQTLATAAASRAS